MKWREFWVYCGLRNCAPLQFVYKEQQRIKQAAPEHWDEYHVIERTAYDEAIAQAKKLREVLDNYSYDGNDLNEDVFNVTRSFDRWLSEVEGDE